MSVDSGTKLNRFIENYSGETFDILVIGGGITGAGVAYDAASRGLSVALVEKQDFGCATSAATSKLIHGGLRYLAHGEFHIVRESLRERRVLENIAPNLVYPIPIFIPCYNKGVTKYTGLVRAGMVLFDLLSYDKSRTWDESKKIPPHRTLPPEKAVELEPVLPKEGLKRVFCYYDCASLFPERLTLAFIKSAVKHGADVSNYCKVEAFVFSKDNEKKIEGVKVKDLITNREIELKSKLTINCGGPWADLILDSVNINSAVKRIRRSEGIHVITRKLLNHYMIAMMVKKEKHFFLIPWRGHTLIGTTDKEYVGNPDEYKVTKQAIVELLETVNDALQGTERIEYKDVLHAYGGLRPLVEDSAKSSHGASRKYEIHDNAKDGLEGLITVEGGKYTTSRNLAQNVLKMVSAKLNLPEKKTMTDCVPLAGCEIKDINHFIEEMKKEYKDFSEKTVECLARYYGNECRQVFALARENNSLAEIINNDGEIPAQAVYAVREEMARTLKDILFRRTGIGTLGNPGDEVIARMADLAARELHWDEARKTKEINEAKESFKLPE